MNRNFGLKPLKRDKRDYSHHKTFGSAPLTGIPDEYTLFSTILNQGATPKCTAYSSCAIREVQAGVAFDPDFFFAQEGVVAGAASADGYDLRITMKTGCNGGFKPTQGDITKPPSDFNEDSFFTVDGPYDLFDNSRSAMAIAKAMAEKRCVQFGTTWFLEWSFAQGGVIQGSYATLTPIGLHALKGAGWTRHKKDGTPLPALPNNDPYLAIQNSYGTGYGDDGIFYFPRAVVNKYFSEGAFIWRVKSDLTPQQIGFIQSAINSIKASLVRIAISMGIILT